MLRVALLLAICGLAWGQGAPEFQRDVRPILNKKCLACHGPDEHGRQAGLRLDTFEGATARGAIVAGNAAKSRVMARVGNDKMPMPPSGPRLTTTEMDTLRRWIDGGAKYTAHWAYAKPRAGALPEVKDLGWVKNDMDRFVLARLEREGLAPSAEASREVLARRAALDLTGMGPEEKLLRAYLGDKSVGAYEKYVDGLLASPRYGERWAKVWLDLARYADSQGYEKDNKRQIWPYRDWVIRAFNENLPFDRFTVLQLAGDLIEDPSIDDLIATGFHRNTMTNTEGGTDDEEFRDVAVRDRVAVTGQVWMGQTWGCAQCHSHKYDPISQKEFYQLYAFLNQTADDDHPSDRPMLKLTSTASTMVLKELEAGKQRKTRIYERGNFLSPGEEVTAGTPAFLHAMPEKAKKNRLGLAEWIVNAENPLTARVAVNRFWARLFGRGIVETEEDFGTQGATPTHPDLLDFLAVEFQKDWNVKRLLKLVVMSATYRQDSTVTPLLREKDPENRLLARGARFRMEAEMVRDQALGAAGLLSEKMYGPPVMPWQPDGVWLVVYNGDRWVTSKGDDRYRRALYTFMRRTSGYPSMMNFDAPTGELCTIRRDRTNTPLQALTTLNDPAFMEAGQKLALEAMEGTARGEDVARRIFERVLVRKPAATELARVMQLHRQTEAELRAKPENAAKLLHYSELMYEEDRAATLLADRRTGSKEWRYTESDPGEGWTGLGFNEAQWKSGPGFFGRLEKPNKDTPITTPWDSDALWLRTVLELPEKMPSKFALAARTNCFFQVYVNGVAAASTEVERAGYYEFVMNEDGQKAFRPGKNQIAIKLTRAHGLKTSQFFDAGLKAVLPVELGTVARGDAGRAAWVVVANTILNLDEALTRR